MQLTLHESPLTTGLGHARHSARPAASFAPAWREIDAAVAPIIGKRGSVALYERSVQLQVAGAETAGVSLLHTAWELLAPMIGPGLTERLLKPLSQLPLAGLERPHFIEADDPLP